MFSPEPLEPGTRRYRGDLIFIRAKAMSFATTVAAVAFRVGLSHRRSGSVRTARCIATTDHDNVGTDNAVRKLQPCYNDLLLISGGEMTTDEAHANIFGTTEYVDRQLGEKSMPTWVSRRGGPRTCKNGPKTRDP
jgi:hypothetical protein